MRGSAYPADSCDKAVLVQDIAAHQSRLVDLASGGGVASANDHDRIGGRICDQLAACSFHDGALIGAREPTELPGQADFAPREGASWPIDCHGANDGAAVVIGQGGVSCPDHSPTPLPWSCETCAPFFANPVGES